MPGCRYGVRDALSLRVVAQPRKSALCELDPRQLTWFEERIEAATQLDVALPPARYAVQFAEPHHPPSPPTTPARRARHPSSTRRGGNLSGNAGLFPLAGLGHLPYDVLTYVLTSGLT